jgi:hypothetical protein
MGDFGGLGPAAVADGSGERMSPAVVAGDETVLRLELSAQIPEPWVV